MLNKVQLIGRLGGDPETATTASGVFLTKFTLATNERFRDRQGVNREETEWHRIVMFGKIAEIAGLYLKKGSLVFLEGKIKTQSWLKDGEKRYMTEIIVNEMKMLGGKEDAQAATAERQEKPQPDVKSNNDWNVVIPDPLEGADDFDMIEPPF